MDIKILGNLLRWTIDQGNLIDRHHQVIQKRIMVNLGLLKSGKVELRRTIDRGNLIKFLGMRCNKFALIMENLLDGDAQSVRYGEMIHDGSGQPDSANSQEEAESETFVMGSDAAEFVNKVKDQVRKRQKNVERCRFWRRAFNNLGNVHGCDDECGDIHGKEFLRDSKFHHEFHRSHSKA